MPESIRVLVVSLLDNLVIPHVVNNGDGSGQENKLEGSVVERKGSCEQVKITGNENKDI